MWDFWEELTQLGELPFCPFSSCLEAGWDCRTPLAVILACTIEDGAMHLRMAEQKDRWNWCIGDLVKLPS